MTVKELYEIVKEWREDFSAFKSNDFYHLQKKVDRNSWFIAIGVGLLMAAQILIRLL